jgi:hypothetical protein
MTFLEFLSSPLRNQWIEEPGIEIYVRKSIRKGVDIDLASMNAYPTGQGALTRFLDKYEPNRVLCVENIHNPRLVPYFEKRGYLRIARDEGSVNMVSKNYGNM